MWGTTYNGAKGYWITNKCIYILVKIGKHFLLYFILQVAYHKFSWPTFTKTSVYKSLPTRIMLKICYCIWYMWDFGSWLYSFRFGVLLYRHAFSIMLFYKLVFTVGIRCNPLWIRSLFIKHDSLSFIYLVYFWFSWN